MRSFIRGSLLAAVGLPLGFMISLASRDASACACGCGIFDVGMSSDLMPADSDSGWSVWLRFNYMNQDQNWEGSSSAPSSDNGDKDLKTSFYTIGGQYMMSRSWGFMAELPMFNRSLTTTDDGTVNGPAGSIYTGHMFDIGDLMLQAVYTGLSPDMSTGLVFGFKLPTGNYTGPVGSLGGAELDRDSLPGTGSTDIVLGAYHAGGLTADNLLSYFVQARFQLPTFIRDDYRPGYEIDAAAGLAYAFHLGSSVKLAPVAQLLVSQRGSDSGANADPSNSGYTRLIGAPGIELRVHNLKFFADVELPIYQYAKAGDFATDGNAGQLVASAAYKLQVGYDF